MTLVWMAVGGLSGLAGGAILGFVLALAVASASAPRNDGTFAMREMIVALPLGALLGFVAGLLWAARG